MEPNVANIRGLNVQELFTYTSRVTGLEETIHDAVVAYSKILSLAVLSKTNKFWSWQHAVLA